MAPSRRLHLRVVFNVGMVGVVNGADAVVALVCVAVLSLSVFWELDGAARKIAEEIERLAERILGGPSEHTRRIHRDGFMAGVKGSSGMLTTCRCSQKLSTGRYEAGTGSLDPGLAKGHGGSREGCPPTSLTSATSTHRRWLSVVLYVDAESLSVHQKSYSFRETSLFPHIRHSEGRAIRRCNEASGRVCNQYTMSRDSW